LSAFRFLDLFGEWGEANEKTETHRSVLVRKPRVRASRGWNLQDSGAHALRERDRFVHRSPAVRGEAVACGAHLRMMVIGNRVEP
jgi:hypothetical protein